jgi:hypothetical protein
MEALLGKLGPVTRRAVDRSSSGVMALGPISLHLDDGGRAGHAVARRDERGRVSVTVRLVG